jgi:hypothetical protein
MTGLGDRHHPEYAIDITGIRRHAASKVRMLKADVSASKTYMDSEAMLQLSYHKGASMAAQ